MLSANEVLKGLGCSSRLGRGCFAASPSARDASHRHGPRHPPKSSAPLSKAVNKHAQLDSGDREKRFDRRDRATRPSLRSQALPRRAQTHSSLNGQGGDAFPPGDEGPARFAWPALYEGRQGARLMWESLPL